MKVEICIHADGPQPLEDAAQAAWEGGAASIELCAAMHLDGLSPTRAQIAASRLASPGRAGLMVMLRPRAGDFCYTPDELGVMLAQIEIAAAEKADGVVFGALRGDQSVDVDALQRLVAASQARRLKTTFHRAFDATPRPIEALETLIAAGVDRLLTSGSPWSERRPALAGVDMLRQIIQRAAGRIEVVIAGGVNARDLSRILEALPTSDGRVSVHAYSGVQKDGLTTAAGVRRLVQAAVP